MKVQTNIAIQTIFRRRSTGRLDSPGPTDTELITILRSGAAAPDHKLTRPFWFVVFEGDARKEFGEILASSLIEKLFLEGREPTPGQIAKERSKLLRAPLVIAVTARVSSTIELPSQEIISAGAAAAQNMLLAATSLGYGSIWRTGEMAYNSDVKASLGIDESDFIIGFLYFGSIRDDLDASPNDPEISDVISVWEP